MDTSNYELEPCRMCDGDGTSLDDNPCPACQGSGRVLAPPLTFEQVKERGDNAMDDAKELQREYRKIHKWLHGSES